MGERTSHAQVHSALCTFIINVRFLAISKLLKLTTR